MNEGRFEDQKLTVMVTTTISSHFKVGLDDIVAASLEHVNAVLWLLQCR